VRTGGRQAAGSVSRLRPNGALAQLGERRLCKPEVIGSIPIRSTPTRRADWWVPPADWPFLAFGRVPPLVVPVTSFGLFTRAEPGSAGSAGSGEGRNVRRKVEPGHSGTLAQATRVWGHRLVAHELETDARARRPSLCGRPHAKLGWRRKIRKSNPEPGVRRLPRPLRTISRPRLRAQDSSLGDRRAALRGSRRSPLLLRRAQLLGEAPSFGLADLHGRRVPRQAGQHEDPLDCTIAHLKCKLTPGSRHQDRSFSSLLPRARRGPFDPEGAKPRMLAIDLDGWSRHDVSYRAGRKSELTETHFHRRWPGEAALATPR
jgi:hypothetical protein